MLRKARTMGLKYPRTGIIGDKHSVTDKSVYLINWLEKNPVVLETIFLIQVCNFNRFEPI